MAKAQKKPAAVKLTYTGDSDTVTLNGGQYVLTRGEAAEVDADTAKRFADNPFFEAEGVEADDPASTVAPEDALAAERAAHQADIDKLNAEHADALKAQAEALKAGWEEQHAADQAEIARLNGLLNNPAPAAADATQPAQG